MKLLTKIINLTLLLQINLVCAFDVYWNIPSMMCKKFVNISNLNSLYGIKQNDDDSFRGNEITILYDPGKFPALLKDEKSGKVYARNGGIPQEGNLQEHLNQYVLHVDEQIPDKDFSGMAVIDFESWRPVFRQNFGALKIYKDYSIQNEKSRHPFWSYGRAEQEAERRFEESGKVFVEETIRLSRQLRPSAKWGYYAFPYCFNNKGEDSCAKQVMNENDRTTWMYTNANTILPSVYLQQKLAASSRPNLVRGRVREAMRISKRVGNLPVYVYIRYVYTDSHKLLTENDLLQVFTIAKRQGAQGIILWGSSNDLKTEESCLKFDKYVKDVIGPISSSFTGSRIFVDNLIDN